MGPRVERRFGKIPLSSESLSVGMRIERHWVSPSGRVVDVAEKPGTVISVGKTFFKVKRGDNYDTYQEGDPRPLTVKTRFPWFTKSVRWT